MRRIRTADGRVFQVRPSFMMPYMIGRTEEIEKGLYMYFSGASHDQVTHNHKRDEMYWWRALVSLGSNHLPGTTVKSPDKLPDHLLADEKHTWWYTERVYLATTVGKGCILGAALASEASEAELTTAYREFETEALELNPNYAPITVNTDGWNGTRGAWKQLFDSKATLLFCFLHVILKIQKRCRRWEKKRQLMSKLWDGYRAETVAAFSQQVRRLREWVQKLPDMPDGAREKVLDFCKKAPRHKQDYSYPEAHRTSAMLDRLMDFQDRMLYDMRYLHCFSLQGTGHLMVRAMAFLWNFHPFGRKTKRHSPFADLNGFVYHENWLQNLLIAASMGGRR